MCRPLSGIGKFNTSEEKEFIQENFPACQNISIDFGLMEKASNVFVLCADFGWADVGTWGSLYDISSKDKNGNVNQEGKSLIYESDNNIIAVPKDKLVVIEGLKNYIVADSDNVLLICRKDEEERIRQIVNDAKAKFGNEFI